MDRDGMVSTLSAFFRDMAGDYGLEMAFLYGSWACGCPGQNSDVDVAVLVSSGSASDDENFEVIGGISLDLTERLHNEVNVLQIERDFKKPMLYYNAIVLGVPIYVHDSLTYLRLREQSIEQMEDFSLFGLKWQVDVARQNLEVLTYA